MVMAQRRRSIDADEADQEPATGTIGHDGSSSTEVSVRRKTSPATLYFRKQQVLGSNPSVGSNFLARTERPFDALGAGPGAVDPCVDPCCLTRAGKHARLASPRAGSAASYRRTE
jgi:hypothetical protein